MPEEQKPDLTLVDREGNAILVADVKYTLPEGQADEVARELARYQAKYELVATREKVYVYDGQGPSYPVLVLDTNDIVRRYDVAGGSGLIHGYYLESIFASWLLDLGQKLYSETPPGADELLRAGILPSLEDTFVVREHAE